MMCYGRCLDSQWCVAAELLHVLPDVRQGSDAHRDSDPFTGIHVQLRYAANQGAQAIVRAGFPVWVECGTCQGRHAAARFPSSARRVGPQEQVDGRIQVRVDTSRHHGRAAAAHPQRVRFALEQAEEL